MRKIRIILIIIFISGIVVRLFTGVYTHDEFGDKYFFLKHRPTWKWKFYSPIGQSDLTFKELTPEKQKEQLYFDEFIRKRGLSK